MNKETLNQDILKQEEIIDTVDSEDYQNVLNEEQEAFENGIEDDIYDIEMEEDDINNETLMFLKSRGKRKN